MPLGPTNPAKTFPSTGGWTPTQLKLAFYLYCQLPFGRLHQGTPEIRQLAKLIHRTPGAVAMKLSNFASLDPAITASGRRGLGNASQLDRETWAAFHDDWESLTAECEAIRASLAATDPDRERSHEVQDRTPGPPDFHGDMRPGTAMQRIGQNFFRRAVLSSYNGECCITGIRNPTFLVASHIVAWSDDPANRLNPANGLCLSTIHDRAFDRHLFSLENDGRILLSRELQETTDTFLRDLFWPLAERRINLPEKFRPNPEFLARHRQAMQSTAGYS